MIKFSWQGGPCCRGVAGWAPAPGPAALFSSLHSAGHSGPPPQQPAGREGRTEDLHQIREIQRDGPGAVKASNLKESLILTRDFNDFLLCLEQQPEQS